MYSTLTKPRSRRSCHNESRSFGISETAFSEVTTWIGGPETSGHVQPALRRESAAVSKAVQSKIKRGPLPTVFDERGSFPTFSTRPPPSRKISLVIFETSSCAYITSCGSVDRLALPEICTRLPCNSECLGGVTISLT